MAVKSGTTNAGSTVPYTTHCVNTCALPRELGVSIEPWCGVALLSHTAAQPLASNEEDHCAPLVSPCKSSPLMEAAMREVLLSLFPSLRSVIRSATLTSTEPDVGVARDVPRRLCVDESSVRLSNYWRLRRRGQDVATTTALSTEFTEKQEDGARSSPRTRSSDFFLFRREEAHRQHREPLVFVFPRRKKSAPGGSRSANSIGEDGASRVACFRGAVAFAALRLAVDREKTCADSTISSPSHGRHDSEHFSI
ncbi:hypothetical protein MRX96_043498 [Rhipicephalus microplus]